MPIASKNFRVKQGTTVKLAQWPTAVPPVYASTKDYDTMLAGHVQRLNTMQELLYASDKYAVLLIFQAMDAAGKDGMIKHVMSGVNPQGCQVFSFKHPSAEELQHDFLWRTSRNLPERGNFGIFNRSYYEEVLIARVHPAILKGENIPDLPADPQKIWKERFRSINGKERHLLRNGTRVIKFFLHLSKDEQKKRFLSRIDKRKKNWKFNIADMEERKYWDEYMLAYEAALGATSKALTPWYIIPADDKKNARLIVSHIILETLEALNMTYPTLDPDEELALGAIRKALVEEVQ